MMPSLLPVLSPVAVALIVGFLMGKDAGVQALKVRSTITCESDFGVCAHCYGRDLARGQVHLDDGIGVDLAHGVHHGALAVAAGHSVDLKLVLHGDPFGVAG